MNKGKNIFELYSFGPRNIFVQCDKHFAMSVTKTLQTDSFLQSILIFSVSHRFRETLQLVLTDNYKFVFLEERGLYTRVKINTFKL